MTDIIRVLRVIEYTGPRDLVEDNVANSIHGTKKFGRSGRVMTINAATIGTFPEILERRSAEESDTKESEIQLTDAK